MKASRSIAIVIFSSGHCPKYRDLIRPETEIPGAGNAFAVILQRLKNVPGISEIIFSVTDRDFDSNLPSLLTPMGKKVRNFHYNENCERNISYLPERWGFSLDEGIGECIGSQLTEAVKGCKAEHLIAIPYSNILVDAEKIAESIRLHLNEGFDATFSADLLPGANWTILKTELLEGLNLRHSDLMSKRGGLYWAIKKPLYPFKVGYFHAPRERLRFSADLRFLSKRSFDVFRKFVSDDFSSPRFSYSKFLMETKWGEEITNYSPSTLFIEPTNSCNAKCLYCPQPELLRERENLSIQNFERLISSFEQKDVGILFSGMGEPLFNQNMKDFVYNSAMAERRIKIYTGLSSQPESDFPWNKVTHLRISFDSNDPASFTNNRSGCSWEQIIALINTLKQAKENEKSANPEIGISFLKHNANNSSALPFLNHWKNKCSPPFRNYFFSPASDSDSNSISPVSWFQIIGASDFLGTKEYPAAVRYTPLNRKVCVHAVSGFHLLSNGQVTICPFDIEGKYACGNINVDSPVQIWCNQQEFRKKHFADELDFEPCAKCNDWYHP
ncbi:MAG: radical SAM protein [Candidatus Riflebacteria bacterium]|nr:radical SAM protein [Candidatus Riflebacteria bacterium]